MLLDEIPTLSATAPGSISRMSPRTPGEQLFEQYLSEYGLSFEFERINPPKRKVPDYVVPWNSREIMFDVKDFDPLTQPIGGPVSFDSYPRIREKIEQGRQKFKEYKEYCCALVLRNLGNPFVMVEHTDIMLGAMYGDSGFTFPINTKTGVGDSSKLERAFLERGKMIRPKWSAPQNTSISALVTLTRVRPGMEAFRNALRRNPSISIDQFMADAESRDPEFDLDRFEPRVIVWHNAFARIPFPADLMNGPYDVHWGIEGELQRETFRGELLSDVANPKRK